MADDLYSALKFTSEDLAANRRGQLTSAQSEQIEAHLQSQSLILGTVAAVLVLFLLYLLTQINHPSDLLTATLFLLPVLLIIAWLVSRRRNQIKTDVNNAIVLSVTDSVTKKIVSNGKTRMPVIHIQGMRFKVSWEVYQAFQDDSIYTIYYAPNSKVIVSAEPIEG